MFLFDARFADRREFNFAEGSVAPQIGWWIGVAAALILLVISIANKGSINAAKRHNQRLRLYENRDLPAGYRDPTVWEIIKRDFEKHWPVYLMVLPVLAFYIIWCYGPMYGIIIAFNDYKPKKGFLGSPWVGLDWYREFFRGPFAWRTIRNTLLISIYNMLIGFPAPIVLALMLNEMRSIAYKRVVQTITYIPHFISLVVMSGLLIDFLSSDGVITTVLSKVFGLPSKNYLGYAQYFRTVYIGSEIWQHLGWDSIIYLSALSAVDQELYEAARIDGAGRLKQTWHVTLPGIAPTITILLILRIGQLLSVGYEKIILIYNASIYETADVISTYVYRVGITDSKFSRSTAINTLNSAVNFLLVVMANKVSSMLSETSLW
ncbi:MAG: sugar ABC transporter permease [Clostridia bacterium]|nr:sugar ABC transporter permease [Clostridia bacterium]